MIDIRSPGYIQLVVIMVAFASGLVVATLAVLMIAGGHGWSGGLFSVSAMLTAPAAAAAWFIRRSSGGRVLAAALTAVNAFVIGAIVMMSIREGASHDVAAWRHRLAWIWAGVWAPWVILPIVAMMDRRGRA